MIEEPWALYAHTALMKSNDGTFYMTIVLAIIITMIWTRFILMLQLTKTFGPILRIIMVMFGDVLKFLFIWSLIILTIASIAALLFGELAEYADFIDVLMIIFDTGMGNYDFATFEDLALGPVFG